MPTRSTIIKERAALSSKPKSARSLRVSCQTAYGCRDGLLASASVGTKQLDLVVHSRSVPRVFERPQLPIELITAAGEVKTRLTKEPEIRATAEKLAGAAAASPRRQAVPFFVLAPAP